MTQALNLANFANNLNTSGQTSNGGLQNSSITITAGTGLSGGGLVALGSSVTLNNAGVTSITAGTGLSVSASTGGVTISATGGPLFSAYMNTNQSISSGVATKLIFNTVIFDSNSNFSTSNYRYTPTVAGYYYFYTVLSGGDAGVGPDLMVGSIYKNGTAYVSSRNYDSVGQNVNLSCGSLIYMNGSTDYIEIYGFESGGSGATIIGTQQYSQFGGYFIRS